MKTIRIYLLEMKYEFLKVVRTPAYAIPTIAFPAIFYIFFGITFGRHQQPHGGVTLAKYLLATYGTFGVLGASLFGFAVTIAMERGYGWMQVKRTSPMPIGAYFAAKMAIAVMFSAIVVAVLYVLGFTLGDVRMPVGAAISMFAILMSGAVTFSALGLAIGYFAGPTSAAPIVNLIFLPMSILSGLWIPIFALPKFIQNIALALPAFHLSQLALGTIGAASGGSRAVHVIALMVATAVFLALAYFGYRRDEGKMYG
ncbi:MAG TPA: ABC transporter permease [Thermoanaerobaculia bacterium]|jgi:ABC-2 type transport system permease protein